MDALWVGRDMRTGPMQYCIFTGKPRRTLNSFVGGTGVIRNEVVNEIGIRMCGRPLNYMECVEVFFPERQPSPGEEQKNATK